MGRCSHILLLNAHDVHLPLELLFELDTLPDVLPVTQLESIVWERSSPVVVKETLE